MRIRSKYQPEAPPNLMPLIDMVFLLLIFFLVATTFHQEEREIAAQLPGAAREINPMSAPPRQLIINILHDGTMKVSGNSVTPEQVSAMLTRVARDEPDRDIMVRADKRSIHKYFAWVVAEARRRGIKEVKIGYIVEEDKVPSGGQ